jgi:hypothetical protein
MGPKKDTKKKGGKSEGPITVDLTDFIREVSLVNPSSNLIIFFG